ncbi:transglycosylase SLT domain-containing protein [Vibrio porteresiae]|uniref:Transglycosylase SLT domain-containing protein n=1 Tax=Vibrio porteresiae DSM 19223 TaxID=1123496 RepID=A0ABZ0QAU4_9VIBR|nr:transglycosylase SLT domain-containing protein [Vibrio porteresiae]WPC73583.1 transglycosylase SLT domain-containing protein [Vibrio porteresiae DSM 19223]
MTRCWRAIRFCGATLYGLALTVCASSFGVTAQTLEQQRDLYDKAQRWLDEDNLAVYQKIRSQLDEYPLTPYLDYRSLLINIGSKPPIVVRAFIDSHQEYPFAARIGAPYITALASQQKWARLVEFQRQEPVGEEYQCWYYYAKLQTGDLKEAFKGAKSLWLKGSSISDACDPLFREWARLGGKTDELIYERMLLAFEGRNISLMSYLYQQLKDEKIRLWGQHMLELYHHPERITYVAVRYPATLDLPSQVLLSIEKLARIDPAKAKSVLNDTKSSVDLTEQQVQSLSQYIALQLVDSNDRKLVPWRDSVIAASRDPDLLKMRIRMALRQVDWAGVKSWISLLPKDEQQEFCWQYWLGRSELETGETEQGHQRLKAIIGHRNFYSVAAAIELRQSVQYPSHDLQFDPQLIHPYQKALTRIEELINRDKITAAKSEWSWLLDRVSQDEKEMLAVYAANKHWYHLTVTASISASLWNNIELRFPLAHQWWFNFYGNKNGIDPVTLMSLARQESAWDTEAQSPVGARGIMQIMPSTAKYTAKKYQIEYTSVNDLYDVSKNIEIGSHYFSSLLKRYDKNRIFALAAYNAGPLRVDNWRKETKGKLGPMAFIEAIPFKETRGYVQNILMFEVYYRDLMGAQGQFLTSDEMKAKY